MVKDRDVVGAQGPRILRRSTRLKPARFSRRRVTGVVALIPLLLSTFGVAAGSASASTPGQSVALFAAADPTWIAEVQNKISASGAFGQVATLPESGFSPDTPSLVELQQYSAVYVWSDSSFKDPDAVGNVLADYIDGGGRVVASAFTAFSAGHGQGISGRFASGNYLPTTTGSFTNGQEETLLKDLPDNPLLAGVASFDGGTASYHNNGLTVKSGSTLVAHWTDGEPLVVYRGSVAELNFYPPSDNSRADFWKSSTDGTRLMVNALKGGYAIGPLATLTLTPSASTVIAGNQLTFTAEGFDSRGNSLGDLTASSTFSTGTGNNDTLSAGPGNNTVGFTQAGPRTITATITTNNIVTTSAPVTVQVTPGALASITISPGNAKPKAGDTVAFSTTGLDAFGNIRGSETAASVFTSSNATDMVKGNSVQFLIPGARTITATDGRFKANTTATVSVLGLGPVSSRSRRNSRI